MISKKELGEIWSKYDGEEKKAPEEYKPLFTVNGFMRLLQGTFFTSEESEEIMNGMNGRVRTWYCSRLLKGDFTKEDIWTEEFWTDLLKSFLTKRLTYIEDDSYYREVIDGIICLLGVNIEHNIYPEYKKFYNNHNYGYFNFPHYIDISKHFGWDLSEMFNKHKGFVSEDSVPKFDMRKWKELFPDSNRITTYANIVSDGNVIDTDELPTDEKGYFDHSACEKKFYKDVEEVTMLQKHLGVDYLPLRQVNDGFRYFGDLIKDYGVIKTFIGKRPVYKFNTVQGFSFYMIGGAVFDWWNAVYVDDISIKKIEFGSRKPKNMEVSTDKRIFIVYNTKTGYWQLPELNYPVKFKNFIKDILKKQKKVIGAWDDTAVFADSRTLCGGYKRSSDYPDIKSKDEFCKKIATKLVEDAKRSIGLRHEYDNLGIKVSVGFEGKFDFDKIVKKLDCITQEDIDHYVNPVSDDDIFTIVKYDK